MKNQLLILFLSVCFLTLNLKANDSLILATQEQLKVVQQIDEKISAIKAQAPEILKKQTTNSYQEYEWVLILFSMLCSVLFIRLILMRFCRREFVEKIITEKQQNASTETENGQEPRKSTSRLIAFLSGIAAIVISVGVVPYWLYIYLIQGGNIDLSSLLNFLLPLGIGVLPYGFNKFSNTSTNLNTTTNP